MLIGTESAVKVDDMARADTIEAILSKFVILSAELLDEVESFIKENAQLGYATKEEFIQDAIRSRLTCLAADKHTPETRRHTG